MKAGLAVPEVEPVFHACKASRQEGVLLKGTNQKEKNHSSSVMTPRQQGSGLVSQTGR